MRSAQEFDYTEFTAKVHCNFVLKDFLQLIQENLAVEVVKEANIAAEGSRQERVASEHRQLVLEAIRKIAPASPL